jgi:hypothetical protein
MCAKVTQSMLITVISFTLGKSRTQNPPILVPHFGTVQIPRHTPIMSIQSAFSSSSFTLCFLWTILMTSSSSSLANAQSLFSYDPSSPVGPANWGKLPGSSCSGLAQSGIDVPTGACTEVNVDYMFQVT